MPAGEMSGTIDHCDRPAKVKRYGFTWEGDYEVQTALCSCLECGAEITVAARCHVGPPGGS